MNYLTMTLTGLVVLADREDPLTEGATVSTALLVVLEGYARDADIDVSFAPFPSGAESRVDSGRFFTLWERTRDASGDLDFGLHLGEYAGRLGNSHAVGQMLVHCETARQALLKLCEYHALLAQPLIPRLEGNSIRLTPSPGERHMTEAIFVSLTGTLRRLLGPSRLVKGVRFQHPEPASRAEHERLFSGAELCFDSPRDELILEPEVLHRALPLPNPQLRELLEGYVRHAHQRLLGDKESVSLRVKSVIGELIQEGRPTLATVARCVAQSP